jgi:hypothetical protein
VIVYVGRTDTADNRQRRNRFPVTAAYFDLRGPNSASKPKFWVLAWWPDLIGTGGG